MRTEQERMELIRKRTLEIRKKEKKRRQRIIDMGCAAACVLLIICLGMLMPQITAQTEGKRRLCEGTRNKGSTSYANLV